ncbi:23S rRNA methylase [Aciduliprofundum sp. MAR08-339]|uniref:RlmE family RNA methyltransferase n=1 Tax=Aciduliprofundum sp. (strain MAR08-339) TaxID=673860 RepID=UPI0002A4CC3E|nr:23S rRNA methylase [Aciduliprofundum sp. MAR08-339]
MKNRDFYYWEAKRRGYRSRASFKLLQINDRFYIIRPGYRVLDLGASPGGWSQVALKLVGEEGMVIGVDVKPIKVSGVKFVRGNVYDEDIVQRIMRYTDYVDVVISDMAPNISGVASWDHARSVDLAERALFIAEKMLRERGHLLVKVFQGDMLEGFRRKCKKRFELVKVHKPRASNRASPEVYVVCKRFKLSSTP